MLYSSSKAHIWSIPLLVSLGCAVSMNDPIFDYVIVGGGTAGTVLASRLSENKSVSVAVIEAGGSALEDPLARTIYGNCPPCATGLDWNYTTVPQQYLNGSVKPYHAGRCLGGTSVLNGKSSCVILYGMVCGLTIVRMDLFTPREGRISLLGSCRRRRLDMGLAASLLPQERKSTDSTSRPRRTRCNI
jgi:hypothetical protein